MSDRATRAQSRNRENRVERELRQARRAATAARQRAEEAEREAREAELRELEAEIEQEEKEQELDPQQPEIMADPNNPQQPQAPVLLNIANTNPYTNLGELNNETARRLWRQATEALSEQFDGSHQHFQVFTANVTTRFSMCNWFRFITFQVDGQPRDLITNPGLITTLQVQERRNNRTQALAQPPNPATATAAQILAYNDAVIENLHSSMMYHFLINSIITPLKTHISQKIMAGLINEDGPLLLKYIQEKVKGRANKQAVLNARSALQNLNLKEFKYNVKKLHDHVNAQVLIISSNGGQVQGDGITAALLKTYKTCNNEEFLHHIRHIEALADDMDADIAYEELMVKAETKYDVLCQTKVWGKKDPRDEQILALQAKLKQMGDPKKGRNNPNKSNNNNNNTNSGKKRRYEDWQYVKPKDGQTHMQKKIKGKTIDFWWCEVLQMWARHKPEDCKAQKKDNAGNKNNKNNTSSNTKTQQAASDKPRLRAQQATTYVMDDSDSSRSDSE